MARKFLFNKNLINRFEAQTGEKALYAFSTSAARPAYTRWLEKLIQTNVDVDKAKLKAYIALLEEKYHQLAEGDSLDVGTIIEELKQIKGF